MTELAVLDVGHGNAAVARHGNEAVVIDAGVGTSLLEYLSAEGIQHIHAVLISHADFDHLKGLLAVLEQPEISVGAVYLNSDAAKQSREWKALAFTLDQLRRDGEIAFHTSLVEDTSIDALPDVGIAVLAPCSALAALGPGSTDDENRRITTNTISAVVRVELGDCRVLLGADIDEVGLDHLVRTRSADDLRANALVFPHHGGNVRSAGGVTENESFADRLLGTVRPERVIFSIGRKQHQNPRPEMVGSVLRAGATVMCTQMSRHCCGDVMLPAEHLSPAFSAGRRLGASCAGSVVLTPHGVTPDPAVHQTFVEINAPTALCRR